MTCQLTALCGLTGIASLSVNGSRLASELYSAVQGFYVTDRKFFQRDYANGLYAASAYYWAAVSAGTLLTCCASAVSSHMHAVCLLCPAVRSDAVHACSLCC